MKLTRRQLFAGLLAPVAAPKLLEAAKPLPVSGVAIARANREEIRRYTSNRFYRMAMYFRAPFNVALTMADEFSPAVPLMLFDCARALHHKVTDAAEGRRIIWRAPMELHAFVEGEWVGPVSPLPRCRHLVAWDCMEDCWVHRLDVDVAFEDPEDFYRFRDRTKIGDTLYIRRPRRWHAHQPA